MYNVSVCIATNKSISDDEMINVLRINIQSFTIVRKRICHTDSSKDTYSLSIEFETLCMEEVDKIVSTIQTRFVCYNAGITCNVTS